MKKLIVHPVKKVGEAPWTFTEVYEGFEDLVAVTSDSWKRFDPQQTQARAVELAGKVNTHMADRIEISNEPFITVAEFEDPAVKEQRRLQRQEAGRKGAEARKANAAKPPKVETPKLKVQPKVDDGFDSTVHYGRDKTCSVCGKFVERTGKRGRPPINCTVHRAEAAAIPKVETPRPFGNKFYAKPCANCGKGVPRTGKRGAQPKYCPKIRCQSARTRELDAKKEKVNA